ncbi:hypothetical protein [Pseudomonas fluorescens]|uniref:hypothetical protein n=1 Tax=Pseudomonas fluorescens TaxID=294 RepID=UPI0029621C72|nr:hypothetical protein [Pseudomonas fluorescens]
MPIDFKHTSRLLPRTVRHINLQINLLVALLRVDAEGLRLVEQRVAEDTAKIEALRTGPSQRSPRLFTPAGQTNQGTVKNPRHIVFYRGANDDVIEVVRCTTPPISIAA